MSAVLVTSAQVVVAAAGTEQRLSAASVTGVVAIYLSAPAANTGTVYVGDSSVTADNGIAILKGTSLEIKEPNGQMLDIYNMYVDAATSGDKLNVSYLKVMN